MKVRALAFALVGLACSAVSLGASATLNDALITRIHHDTDATRGPNGRAFIAVDQSFPLPGVCLYSGVVNSPAGWMIEFDVEHGSFNALFALAVAAHANGKLINVTYDDGFGPGTTCRITSLVIAG